MTKKKCFVIMPFGGSFDTYHDNLICPAIEDAKLHPIRGDDCNKPGVIAEQIWSNIREASLCIADITGRNPNVMYELGLAHALKKPVIIITQDSKIGNGSKHKVPFDISHFRHIIYDPKIDGWKAKLCTDITKMAEETIKDPFGSISLDAPKTIKIFNCTGSISELSYVTDEKITPVKPGSEDRLYSKLENSLIAQTDSEIHIRLFTRMTSVDYGSFDSVFTGSGPVLGGAAFLHYSLDNLECEVTSLGTMVLRIQHAREMDGFWMTTGTKKGDFLFGRINLIKLRRIK